MPDPQMKLPPGATLVSTGPAMALPPGATLVSDSATSPQAPPADVPWYKRKVAEFKDAVSSPEKYLGAVKDNLVQIPKFAAAVGEDVKGALSSPGTYVGAPVSGGIDAIKQLYEAARSGHFQAEPEFLDRIGGALGINTQGVREAAQKGDLAGVVGHAAVPVGTVAAAGATKAGQEAAQSITKSVVDVPARAIESVQDATKTVASKVLPSLVDGPPEEMMTRAVKPRNKNSGWNPAVKSAMPNLKIAEQELGKPVEGLDDALQATTLAKKNIWQQYEERLGSNANAQIDGNKVADAMMRSIDRRTATQNPQLAERVAAVADTYRRPMTLAEAEEFLQSANNDLHNYYAKNKVGQRVALGDPEKAYTVAEANALRSELYSRLDDLGGPGAAELKKQYGALSNIEEEMLNRKNVAARQNPQSLSEQLSIARGYGKIAKGVVTFSPGDIAEGAETVGSAKYLKERNSTDAMIQRAFAAYKTPSGPSVAPPTAPNIAGLLPSGPIVTPPPADASGTPPGYRPPPIDATTRAVRKGLLLPDKTATPLPEWIGDAPGKVLNAKSVLVRDAKTGRMRRMYVTSGQ